MRARDALRTGAALAALVLVAAGCGGGDSGAPEVDEPAAASRTAAARPPAAAPRASADPTAEAEQIFSTRCLTCHGPEGAGDGPGSGGLTPPPRNLQDASWQDSVTDEHIEKIIMYGGAAVGKSLAMPANPDLMSKADVVAALRAHIRGLRR